MADTSGVDFKAPAQGVIAMTSGVALSPNQVRGILVDNSGSAGTATFAFGDGTSVSVHLAAATLYQFNWAIKSFTNGTASPTVTGLI